MSDPAGEREKKAGFLDSLGRLFRSREETPAAREQPESGFARLEAEFEAAVRGLNERIEEQRRGAGVATAAGPAAPRQRTPEELAAERTRRTEAARAAMREDIVKMHARLGTGLSGSDLDAIAERLGELEAMAAEGKGSRDLLPRARHAIAEKLRAESGELAIARVVALLQRQSMDWPDPYRPPASATPEEVASARRRRLADLRRAFLGDGFARTAETLQGVVKGWGADYPERGSPLWEACVLEGVTAGIRGKLLCDFLELLQRDREQLLAEAEAAVGKETAALQQALAGGVRSLEQATRAVDGAFKVIDEVMPAIAWERIRAQLPEARGELG
jgi:hypothetical protein